MIPFGNIRGNGADLAVHLGNTHDNESVEIDEIRGLIADDLPGAFAEMDAKIKTLTQMKKGYYSLAINPDPKQGDWPREWFHQYRDQVEADFELIGHDRVTVFHIKEGTDGILREHCHVVWNRTDVQNSRGVDIKFDRLKLMAITREFAQQRGIQLPEGYYHIEKNHEQTTLYERVKEAQFGLTKEQHKEIVTDLWRTSDSPKAFVAALEDCGYMLATGNRPYVLVDSYGGMHALPKLINDKEVRSKNVEAYLNEDFPPESLSTVEEAKAVAAKIEESRKRIELSHKLEEQKEILRLDQEKRHTSLQADVEKKEAALDGERSKLSDRHGDALYAQLLRAEQQNMEVNFKRAANAPSGLAGFLSRITGMDAVRRKLHAHQDKKREAIQQAARQKIEDQNRQERLDQEHRHTLEKKELRRLEREQVKAFEREQRSIEMAQQREKAAFYSRGYEHMPSVQLALKPPGRLAVPAKAQRRHYAPTVKAPNSKQKIAGEQNGNERPPAFHAKQSVRKDFDLSAEDWLSRGYDDDLSVQPTKDKDSGRDR